MSLSRERLDIIAGETGFRQEMLEKVVYLISLLDVIAQDEYLKDRVVLKGGTALNLFHFDLPRLSVDIDLNYIGSLDPEVMKTEREQIEKLLGAICKSLNLNLAKLPDEYACRKYTATYQSYFSGRGNIQVDINYLHRVTYWLPQKMNSSTLDSLVAKNVPIISMYELTGGKLAALLARTASRDLFDVAQIATKVSSSDPLMRLAYVVYGAKQPKDWRRVTLDAVRIDATELADRLLPVLNASLTKKIEPPETYAKHLVEDCTTFVAPLFPLTEEESEFIRVLRETGKIEPSLITADEALAAAIRDDPALLWRASKAGSS